MARSSKLSKLKGALKRWNSSSGRAISRSASAGASSGAAAAAASSRSHRDDDAWLNPRSDDEEPIPSGLHPVFVGKSRRRYLLSSHLVSHPLFRHLLARPASGAGELSGEGLVVGCEVVLFEHLLWMLENADPAPESLDELVEFYAC